MCAAESYPQDKDSVRLLVLALLAVLGGDRKPATAKGGLWHAVTEALRGLCDLYDKSFWEPMHAVDRYLDPDTGNPLAGVVTLLAEFGAVTGDVGTPVITPLGRWAAGHLSAGLPALADPGCRPTRRSRRLPSSATPNSRIMSRGGGWRKRDAAEAAREILTAAEKLPPLLRGVAIRIAERLGEDALPAWRELAAAPRVGPHARAVLADWGQGPEPGDADWRWLGVEAAAAALAGKGPDEALSRVRESMPGPTSTPGLRPCGPPVIRTAGQSRAAAAEFAASGAPRSIDQVAELKVRWQAARPPTWRRVQLPVTPTLGDLHEAIQVLFGWDGDHLHVFAVEEEAVHTRSRTWRGPVTRRRSGCRTP